MTIEHATAQIPPIVIAAPHVHYAHQRHREPPSRPLAEIDVAPPAFSGDMPADLSDDLFSPPTTRRTDEPVTVFTWTPTNQQHKPLYFDDLLLERYGQRFHPPLQPFASAARFYGTFAVMPIKLLVNPPHDAVPTLGQQRPGSPATYRR